MHRKFKRSPWLLLYCQVVRILTLNSLCVFYILDYFITPFLDMVYCWVYSFYWANKHVLSLFHAQSWRTWMDIFCVLLCRKTNNNAIIKILRKCIILGLLLWNQNHGSNSCYLRCFWVEGLPRCCFSSRVSLILFYFALYT
jgi:hypothetical protein